MSSQLVACVQSIPCPHEYDPLHKTLHGTPFGQTTFGPHEYAPKPQSITQTPFMHVPPFIGHTLSHFTGGPESMTPGASFRTSMLASPTVIPPSSVACPPLSSSGCVMTEPSPLVSGFSAPPQLTRSKDKHHVQSKDEVRDQRRAKRGQSHGM